MASKPTMFIGSSKEAETLAQALQTHLQRHCETTLWSGGFFELGSTTFEKLLTAAHEYDFAAFVLSDDDVLEFRGKQGNSPRGNVLFELGLFMGSLGRHRVFPVISDDNSMFIPTDFYGVTVAYYLSRDLDKNDLAACNSAMNGAAIAISHQIHLKKRRTRPPTLTSRTISSISAYLDHRRADNEQFFLAESDDAGAALELFVKECHVGWDNSGTYDAVYQALDKQPFGMYVSAAGLVGNGSSERKWHMDCCMKRSENGKSTLLAGIIGNKEASESEIVETRRFSDALLSDVLIPTPFAAVVQCQRDLPCRAQVRGAHQRKLVFSCNAPFQEPGPDDFEGAVAAIDSVFAFSEFRERLRNLQKIYAADYMGREIKAILLIPIQGFPGIVLQILTKNPILITGASVVSGVDDLGFNEKSAIEVSIDEIMAIRLSGERLMSHLARTFQKPQTPTLS